MSVRAAPVRGGRTVRGFGSAMATESSLTEGDSHGVTSPRLGVSPVSGSVSAWLVEPASLAAP